jgi:plasmid stabilization system protein ParE
MPELIWSRPSRNDLAGIGDYLKDKDPEAALRILRAIREKAALLAAYPEAGPPLGAGVRSLRVTSTPYTLFYEFRAGSVFVLRIRHVREDWRG